MTIEDIINGNVGKPVGPTWERKTGNITTRYYGGPTPRITRTITFAGREIELASPLDMMKDEQAVREPIITTSLSPVGRIEANRKPMEVFKYE